MWRCARGSRGAGGAVGTGALRLGPRDRGSGGDGCGGWCRRRDDRRCRRNDRRCGRDGRRCGRRCGRRGRGRWRRDRHRGPRRLPSVGRRSRRGCRRPCRRCASSRRWRRRGRVLGRGRLAWICGPRVGCGRCLGAVLGSPGRRRIPAPEGSASSRICIAHHGTSPHRPNRGVIEATAWRRMISAVIVLERADTRASVDSRADESASPSHLRTS